MTTGWEKVIKFKYTDYKSLTSTRTVEPVSVIWAHNDRHPEDQWMLHGYDYDKQTMRTFALKDCDFTTTEISVTSNVKEEE
jgi:predicted DNA-binding transcriptional regulator YafY